jgi:hypothetical protein
VRTASPEKAAGAGPKNEELAMRRISAFGERVLGFAARIGLDPTDSQETALRKRLAVVLRAGTLPLTALWSVVYLAVNAPLVTAAIPGF